jgi:hypothetical protein
MMLRERGAGTFGPHASVTSDTDTDVTLACVWTPRAETIPGTDAVSSQSYRAGWLGGCERVGNPVFGRVGRASLSCAAGGRM